MKRNFIFCLFPATWIPAHNGVEEEDHFLHNQSEGISTWQGTGTPTSNN